MDGSADLFSRFVVRNWWLAASLTQTVGGIVSGSLEDTYEDNGQRLILSELNIPGPAFDYTFTFTDLPDQHDMIVRFNGYYDGNPAHIVRVMAWNFGTSSWEYLTAHAQDLPDAASDQDYAWDANNPDWYSGGEFRLRIVHESNGSVGHQLLIDYLWLDDTVHSECLHAETVIRNYAIRDLISTLVVRHSATSTIKGNTIIRHPDEFDLDAHFHVERTWKELFAKTFIRGLGSATVKSIVNVKHPASTDLLAEFTVRQDAVNLKGVAEIVPNEDLFASLIVNQSNALRTLSAEFQIGLMLNEELRCEFTVLQETSDLFCKFWIAATRDMFEMIGYDMSYLINTVDPVGRGFIGSPAPLSSEMGPHGRPAMIIASPRKAARYKEVRFGWMRSSEQEVLGFDGKKTLYAKFRVRSEMRDFYSSSPFGASIRPVYIDDDHYKIEGRTTDFGVNGASLVSWKTWASGTVQADINLDPPATEEIGFIFGWTNAEPIVNVLVGAYAALFYITGTGWIFASTENESGATPAEETDVSAWMDFNQHEIKVTREAPSGPFPRGRFMLYIDGVLRATHSTNIPYADDLGALIVLGQQTTLTALESLSVDIDDIILPN